MVINKKWFVLESVHIYICRILDLEKFHQSHFLVFSLSFYNNLFKGQYYYK